MADIRDPKFNPDIRPSGPEVPGFQAPGIKNEGEVGFEADENAHKHEPAAGWPALEVLGSEATGEALKTRATTAADFSRAEATANENSGRNLETFLAKLDDQTDVLGADGKTSEAFRNAADELIGKN